MEVRSTSPMSNVDRPRRSVRLRKAAAAARQGRQGWAWAGLPGGQWTKPSKTSWGALRWQPRWQKHQTYPSHVQPDGP
eukprot:4530338-Prymnesium_polylepis.1